MHVSGMVLAGVALTAVGCGTSLSGEASPFGIADAGPSGSASDASAFTGGPLLDASSDTWTVHDGALGPSDGALVDAAASDAGPSFTGVTDAANTDASVSGDGGGVADAPAFDGRIPDAATDDGGLSDASLAVDCDADGACATSPYFAAQWVSQSFPPPPSPLMVGAGQTVVASLVVKNTGTTPWTPTTRLATTEPRGRTSSFADSSWISSSAAVGASATIAPGDTFTFSFDLHAPTTAGTYVEHFGFEDGPVWFGDPGQGGPADTDIAVQIVVSGP